MREVPLFQKKGDGNREEERKEENKRRKEGKGERGVCRSPEVRRCFLKGQGRKRNGEGEGGRT